MSYQQLRFTDAQPIQEVTTSTPIDDNQHDARTANSSYAIAISLNTNDSTGCLKWLGDRPSI